MKRQWHTCRTIRVVAKVQQSWDHAYQLLLRWVPTSPQALPVPVVPTPLPDQELPRARSRVCPRLDHPPSPAADDCAVGEPFARPRPGTGMSPLVDVVAVRTTPAAALPRMSGMADQGPGWSPLPGVTMIGLGGRLDRRLKRR